MAERLATLVIGSGFGGSVVAHRLTAAGEKVTLLERGPWRDTQPMRRRGLPDRRPLPAGAGFYRHLLYRLSGPAGLRLPASTDGLFDIHYDPAMSLIASSGVGGGSHVYSAMNTRPARADYWDGHVDGVDAAVMEPYYDWMLDVMGARAPRPGDGIPCFTGDALRDHEQLGADVDQPAMGFDFERARFRDNSYFGSPTGEKRTLDELLLAPALEQGLDLRAHQEVRGIAATGETPYRYRVRVYDHARKRMHYLLAERVVLAAGTLNTVKLLFASRADGGLDALPGLGLGFSGNGDQVALWWCNDPADLSAGPPTHGRLALRGAGDEPYITRFGFNGIDSIPMPARLRRKLRHQAILVCMGEDGANGRLRWQRGRLRVAYDPSRNPVLGQINDRLQAIGQRTNTPVRFLRGRPFTVHPLGGARLAPTPEEGVVDADGRVFGHDGLHVADAAALPAAPGRPPSMTISAWAAHVSDRLLATGDSP